MTKAVARDPIYRRRRFAPEIIELCVRWYLAGTIGAGAALWNAVNDALAALGAAMDQQPFSPDRVLRALATAACKPTSTATAADVCSGPVSA